MALILKIIFIKKEYLYRKWDQLRRNHFQQCFDIYFVNQIHLLFSVLLENFVQSFISTF